VRPHRLDGVKRGARDCVWLADGHARDRDEIVADGQRRDVGAGRVGLRQHEALGGLQREAVAALQLGAEPADGGSGVRAVYADARTSGKRARMSRMASAVVKQ
jgi:hypothetical protein